MQSVKRHVGCSFLCVLKECTVRKCHIMSHNKLLTWVFFLFLSLFFTSSWWHDIKLERLWLQQAGRWLEEKMVCQCYSYNWWTKRSNPTSASLQAALSLTIVCVYTVKPACYLPWYLKEQIKTVIVITVMSTIIPARFEFPREMVKNEYSEWSPVLYNRWPIAEMYTWELG